MPPVFLLGLLFYSPPLFLIDIHLAGIGEPVICAVLFRAISRGAVGQHRHSGADKGLGAALFRDIRCRGGGYITGIKHYVVVKRHADPPIAAFGRGGLDRCCAPVGVKGLVGRQIDLRFIRYLYAAGGFCIPACKVIARTGGGGQGLIGGTPHNGFVLQQDIAAVGVKGDLIRPLCLCPVGVQGGVGRGLCAGGDFLAAGFGRVPAGEGVARAVRSWQGAAGCIGSDLFGRCGAETAVGVKGECVGFGCAARGGAGTIIVDIG